MPDDDDTDPNIYVEETVTFLLPTHNKDQIITDESQAYDYEELKRETGIEYNVCYLNSIENGMVEQQFLDKVMDESAECEDSDESYVSEETANKMAMSMML